MLTKEKQSVEAPNSQTKTTPLRGIGEQTPYPPSFALPRENPATYASPSQAFPLNYGPLQIVKTPGLVLRETQTGTDPVDPLAIPDLDELAEKGKSLWDKGYVIMLITLCIYILCLIFVYLYSILYIIVLLCTTCHFNIVILIYYVFILVYHIILIIFYYIFYILLFYNINCYIYHIIYMLY